MFYILFTVGLPVVLILYVVGVLSFETLTHIGVLVLGVNVVRASTILASYIGVTLGPEIFKKIKKRLTVSIIDDKGE